MNRLKTGLIHVYTGCGKGKTSAALGLALRAHGSGLKVCIHQFLKKGRYGEKKALGLLRGIKLRQWGRRPFVRAIPVIEDKVCAKKGLDNAARDIVSGKFQLVILDEVNVALNMGLINADDLLKIMDEKCASTEIVLTGRGCPKSILNRADLITEMREIRHPYKKGVMARKGIEY